MPFHRRSTGVPGPRGNSAAGQGSIGAIEGVRAWLHGIRLSSSGLSELDDSIGGGIPLHSLALFKEDEPTSYYRTLVRQFVGEGAARGHNVIVADADSEPLHISKWPFVVGANTESKSNLPSSSMDGGLGRDFRRLGLGGPPTAALMSRPALPRVSTVPKRKAVRSASTFDLSRPLQDEVSRKCRHLFVPLSSESPNCDSSEFYRSLLNELRQHLENLHKHMTPNLTRIVLHSLESPLLPFLTSESRHLFLFLLSLRTLARSFPCIILVTMPSLVFEGPLRDRLEPLFDLVVGFHSLACRPSKYSDFDAVLKIERLARINSLKSFRPSSLEYLLKVEKRKVRMEKPSLPPEHTRAGDSKSIAPAGSCSGSSNLPGDLSF